LCRSSSRCAAIGQGELTSRQHAAAAITSINPAQTVARPNAVFSLEIPIGGAIIANTYLLKLRIHHRERHWGK
jgi:hypothetical protein